jgi:hypothetical protein
MAMNDISLKDALALMTVEELKSVAGWVYVDTRGLRKAELVAELARAIDSDRMMELWAELDDIQRRAVEETLYSADGTFHAEQFQAKYGALPDWGRGSGYRPKPSRLCLFIYDGVIPTELSRRLKTFVPKPPQTELQTEDEPPASLARTAKWFDSSTRKRGSETIEIPIAQVSTERSALHDVVSVLRLVSAGKVAVSDKTFHPSATAMGQIRETLLGGDYYADVPEGRRTDETIGPIKAFAWPMLLQASGLAEVSGKKLVLSQAGQRALTAPAAETVRSIWKAWLKTTLLDEMRRVSAIKGQTGRGMGGMTSPKNRRGVICKALGHCPVGRWVQVDAFFRYMRAVPLDFIVSRNPWDLYISESYYGSLGYSGVEWTILQGRYILAFLLEYASTLGVVDVAMVPPTGARTDHHELWGADDLSFLSRYDGLLYFRLTPLGEYCLGLSSRYTPAPIEKRPVLRVMPNMEIAGVAPIGTADALFLDLFARKTADAVWTLDRAKILASLEEGHSAEELEEFLSARSANEIPGPVLRMLGDLAERIGRVTEGGPARLFECADHALAVLIANDSKTRAFCMLAGDRNLAVPEQSVAAFRRALRQIGYAVKSRAK